MTIKKHFKTFLSLLLIFTLLILIPLPKANAMTFNQSYDYLIKEGNIAPYSNGQFRPASPLLREEAAFFLALGNFDPNYNAAKKSSYRDVNAKDFYSPYIEKTKRIGVMSGYSKDIFKPKETITRFQAAAILNRTFKLTSKTQANKSCFNDVSSKHWAKHDVCALSEAGIIKGVGNGKFNGNAKVTRGQFAMMYARAFNHSIPLNNFNYKFEPELLNNFYFQEGRKLNKINPNQKQKIEVWHKMKKYDMVLKEKKKVLGKATVEKALQKEPLGYVITNSKQIGGSGGLYQHKDLHSFEYIDGTPPSHLMFFSDYKDDFFAKRVFIHEFGHYVGFSFAHIDYDFSIFHLLKDINLSKKNNSFIPIWGDRDQEAFADTYAELFFTNYQNRTKVGNFANQNQKNDFKNWIIHSMKE